MVGEVDEVMAKWWARHDGRWCGGAVSEHCGGDAAVLGLLWRVKERQRESKRARVSERGGFTSIFSPC